MNTTVKQRKSPLLARLAAVVAAAATLCAGTVFATSASAAPKEGEEVTNIALKGSENEPETSVSYVTGWNQTSSLNNGVKDGSDGYGGWGTWGHSGDTEWAQYTWNKNITTAKSTAYFWTNVPGAGTGNDDGGVLLPKSVSLQYLNPDTNTFETVKNLKTDYTLPTDITKATWGPYALTFDEVTTTALRLVVNKQANDNKGITVPEWEVYGSVAPTPIDPGEPNTFLWTQEVDVRTTPGVDPTSKLPNTIWATPENGPTTKLNVQWNPIGASQYAAAGTFTVKGVTAKTVAIPATNVEATVQVVDSLNTEVEDAEYVSTVTQVGKKPVFPDTVYLEYADGTKESGHKVTWGEPAADDYDAVDDFGSVDGTVEGTDIKSSATWFVVEPTDPNAAPVVSLDFNTDAQNGTGYFVSTPQFTITAQRGVSNVSITKLEYRINNGDWQTYNGTTKVNQQGTIKVEAKATDANGHSATQEQTIKVDTNKPTTKATSTVKGRIATVTITPNDGTNGSGVTRTVYSNGPSSNPSSNENTMWATYNEGEPVKIELSKTADTYVHYYSQDAAGNEQSRQTLNLGKAQELAVDSVKITGDGVKDGKLSVEEGQDFTLQATVSPAEATNPDVTWSSSDENVVKVTGDPSETADGSLTALKPGKATVTATAEGGKKATVEVTVTEAKTANKDALNKAYDVAKDISNEEGQYTADSWKAFSNARDAAKKVLDDKNVTQQQVDDALVALQKAQDGLKEATPEPGKPDVSKLQAAVDAAGKLDKSAYTADSWKAFVDALTKAKSVLANANATQQQVDDALVALQKAQDGLVKAGETPNPTPNPSGNNEQPSGKPSGNNQQNANGQGTNQSGSELSKTGVAVASVAAAVVLMAVAGVALTVLRKRHA